MTLLTETLHRGGFIVSEADKTLSRDQVTLALGQNLKAGTVLGKSSNAVGAPVFAAAGGNTGNGAMGAITPSQGIVVGVYTLEITAAIAGSGEFDVYDPAGNHVGQGRVGVLFNHGGLSFTLANGGTAFAVGDTGTITVAPNAIAGQYVVFDPTALDGSQNAAAILYDDTDATLAIQPATVVSRNAEVNVSELVWGANVTTQNQKTAALAQLAANGVIGR